MSSIKGSNDEEPNPLQTNFPLLDEAEEEPQPDKGHIWVAQELEIMRGFLVQYKGLGRKEKRPFLRQTAIPAIKKVWGARYKDIDERDKEKKREWRIKKTVCIKTKSMVTNLLGLCCSRLPGGSRIVPEKGRT
jgi:hypothetical protein